jgi:hypothetical protein
VREVAGEDRAEVVERLEELEMVAALEAERLRADEGAAVGQRLADLGEHGVGRVRREVPERTFPDDDVVAVRRERLVDRVLQDVADPRRGLGGHELGGDAQPVPAARGTNRPSA